MLAQTEIVQMKSMAVKLSIASLLAFAGAATAAAQNTGPSTTRAAEYIPSAAGVVTTSIASNGNGTLTANETYVRLNTGVNNYRLVGIPDGMGAFRTAQDIIDGTFSLLVNHELGNSAGIVRDHGSRGGLVSLWSIRADPANLQVIGGKDLIQNVYLWNTSTNAFQLYNAASPMPTYANNTVANWNLPDPSRNGFNRFCSADMAEPSAYRFGAFGTDARIFLNGEEVGAPGRAFAHIASGPDAGTSYELAEHGDYSWENNVACPFPQLKTVCIGLDDSTPGNLYLYVGEKRDSGNDIQRSGLLDGNLYAFAIDGVTVNASGQPVEDRTFVLGNAANGRSESKRFRTFQITDPKSKTGADLQALDAQGQFNWARPEDGHWDLSDPTRFYFATTDSFTGNSRLWVMVFDDISNPQNGGTVTMLGDGSNPSTFAGGIISANGITDVRMMDNLTATKNGKVIIQEDVGNNPRLGRMWIYDLYTDSITEIAQSSPALYLSGAPGFLTQDEEASGVIEARDILGPGWFLINNQSHFAISGELAEGGQLMALFVPAAVQLCPADANADGFIDFFDFDTFVTSFETGTTGADFNRDGFIDFFDFDDFVTAFAAGC
jgi:hypothetical protein